MQSGTPGELPSKSTIETCADKEVDKKMAIKINIVSCQKLVYEMFELIEVILWERTWLEYSAKVLYSLDAKLKDSGSRC